MTASRPDVVGRLAPTPSGGLHLGNITAFAAAWLSARQRGGRLLLRVEDIDTGRAREPIVTQLREDLRWLGLGWDEEVARQSTRTYDDALRALAPNLYRCVCTRQQLSASHGRYPGTCRDAGHADGAIRLRLPEGRVTFVDRRHGPQTRDPAVFGDPVLVRRDGLVAYNLAVVVDDLRDGVTEVVRGGDLLDYTAVQLRIYEALGASPPSWLHAPLVLGPDGRKLSKSHASLEVAALRARGWSPREVWRVVLPWLGVDGDDPAAAVDRFDPTGGVDPARRVDTIHAPAALARA